MVRSAGAGDSVVLFGEGDADIDDDECTTAAAEPVYAADVRDVQVSASELSAAAGFGVAVQGEPVRVSSSSVSGGAKVSVRPDAQATQRPHGPGARTWRDDEPTAPFVGSDEGQPEPLRVSVQEQGLL